MRYSFIIPVYNAGPWLAACVESVRAVEAADYEILLVNDGSTDDSGDRCDALAARYPEVRAVHQANGGVSSARNRGIREARGEKLLFLDADDTIDPAALGALLADPRCGEADLVVYGICFDYYAGGKCYRSDALYDDWDGLLDRKAWADRFARLYANNALSSMCTKIFSRRILMEHRLELNTDMFLYEDLEFVLRYLPHCGKIWNVPRGIYHYRQSEDEGNAGRRLARIGCLRDFLVPIEAALNGLDHVDAGQKEAVLVQLFQILAREKIAVSGLKEIRMICEDYAAWYRTGGFTAGGNDFHRQLMGGKAAKLKLQNMKTALRHRIAVWAKVHHLYKA